MDHLVGLALALLEARLAHALDNLMGTCHYTSLQTTLVTEQGDCDLAQPATTMS